MTTQSILQFLVSLPILLISLAAHELAHAGSATALGDPTPRATGRLTLNPLAHLDLWCTLMLVVTYLALGFAFGYAKPVQIDPRYLDRHRFGQTMVAVSGPATNLVLAVICCGLAKAVYPVSNFGGEALWTAFVLNMVLAVLNILPIPPLDGWRAVTGLLPHHARAITDRFLPYESYVFIAFFAVLYLLPGVWTAIFVPPISAVASLFGL